ncbi:hypothetical protein ACNKHL_16875 [Shigella flexneri]
MAQIGIFARTMYGNSLLVAEEAEAILTAQGHKATVFELVIKRLAAHQDKYVLVVTSTTCRATFLIALCRSFRESKIVWGFQPNLRYA